MASIMNEYLQPSTALTADSTSAAFLLTQNTENFIGTIIATNVNAATTIAAKIQHSPNGSNWFDLVTFTNIVGVAGSEVKQITDSVLPYVRSVVDLSGATQAATVEIKLWFDLKG